MTEETKQEAQEGQPQGKTAQDRINQLIKQRGESERENEQLRAELEDLKSQVGSLRKSTSQPTREETRTEGKDAFDALFSSSPRAPKSAQPVDIDAIVTKAVERTVERISQEQSERRRLEKLQLESFNNAVATYGLDLKPGSQGQALFDTLWEKFPGVKADPDGPALIVMAVDSLMRGDQAPKQTHKEAAAQNTAALQSLGRAPERGIAKSKGEQEAVDTLVKESATRELSNTEIQALTALKLGTAKVR